MVGTTWLTETKNKENLVLFVLRWEVCLSVGVG